MISKAALDHWHKMLLAFIDKKLSQGVKVVLKDKLTDVRGGELCGITMPDQDHEDHYCVFVSVNSNQVSTLIHEFLHKMFPDQAEDFIQNLEKELVTSFTTAQLKKFKKYLK